MVQGFSQLLSNGGFEEWTTNGSQIRPVDWAAVIIVNGSSACSGYHPYYEQSNDALEGNFALYIEVEECLSKTAGLILKFGTIHTSDTQAFPPYDFAVTCDERPDYLSFYYKFQPEGGDTAVVDIMLFNYDEIEYEVTDTIGVATGLIISAAGEYTEYQLPIEYLLELNPSFVSIRFNASFRNFSLNTPNLHGHDGTNLTIDKVEFHGGTLVGEVELGIERPITLSPNPSNAEFVTLNYSTEISIERIEIIDELGRLILRQTGSSSQVNMQSVDSGMYYFRVLTSEGTETIRFVKL